jgi:hypothetical protein
MNNMKARKDLSPGNRVAIPRNSNELLTIIVVDGYIIRMITILLSLIS